MSRSVSTIISVFVIGILVVVAGFFLLDIESIALNFWALGSLLFSFVVSLLAMLTLVAPKRNKDGLFYTAGLSSVIFIYEITVIISILFTHSFVDKLNSFILLQISINALFLIIAVIIIVTSGRIYDHNAKTSENIKNGEYSKPKRGGF